VKVAATAPLFAQNPDDDAARTGVADAETVLVGKDDAVPVLITVG